MLDLLVCYHIFSPLGGERGGMGNSSVLEYDILVRKGRTTRVH